MMEGEDEDDDEDEDEDGDEDEDACKSVIEMQKMESSPPKTASTRSGEYHAPFVRPSLC